MLGRSPWPQRFLAAAAWIVGARVRVDGAPIAPHTLLIANHTSWLDILVLGGATGLRLRVEGRARPSAASTGSPTRMRRSTSSAAIVKGAKDQAIAIAKALERDKPVAVFPEGTTGPGHASAAVPLDPARSGEFAAKDVDDPPGRDRLWRRAAPRSAGGEEPGKDNVLRILGRRGPCRSPSTCSTRSTAPATASSWRSRRAKRSRERSASSRRRTRL